MKNIIKKIFTNKEYTDKKNISNDKVLFFEKENQEYFLVTEYSNYDILQFFESDKTNKLINFFDEIKKGKGDIQKNTSLIILLKLGSLGKLQEKEIKNQIFTIEEDEYFFRKYVIVYTDKRTDKRTKDSISGLTKFDFTEEKLSKKIQESGKFEQFQKDNYFSDEYFFLMQLFIKLPFLAFENIKNKQFESIAKKVDNLKTREKNFKKLILENFSLIESNNIDNLEKQILSETDEEIEFLKIFNK